MLCRIKSWTFSKLVKGTAALQSNKSFHICKICGWNMKLIHEHLLLSVKQSILAHFYLRSLYIVVYKIPDREVHKHNNIAIFMT